MSARAIYLAILLAAAAPGSAAAQGADDSSARVATILGAGAMACPGWVRDRKADGQDAHTDEAWVEGYLSAMATVLPHPDALARMDTTRVLTWMDSYCAQNGQDSVGKAATALFLELRAGAAASASAAAD